MPLQVLTVDDSPCWRMYILKTLAAESDLKIVGHAVDGFEAVQKASELRPDVVVMDLSLPGINGLDATRRIRMVSPDSKVLFFSGHAARDLVAAAFEAGGSGYILKSDAAFDLVPGIRAIWENRQYVSRSLGGDGRPSYLDRP